MTSGNIGSSAGNFLETMQSLGKSPLEAKQELFKFLESNESTLSREDVNALRHSYHWASSRKDLWESIRSGTGRLDGKVADNQDKMVQRRAEERKADQANVENIFAEESAKRRAAGNPTVLLSWKNNVRSLKIKNLMLPSLMMKRLLSLSPLLLVSVTLNLNSRNKVSLLRMISLKYLLHCVRTGRSEVCYRLATS